MSSPSRRISAAAAAGLLRSSSSSSFIIEILGRRPIHSLRVSRSGRPAAAHRPCRLFSSSPSTKRGQPPPPFATVPTCPSPTCACEPMPELPANLPIDHKAPLNGLIAAYNEQVLVCTGTSDWPSRIEDANSGDNLAADLKELFGRGGVYSDVSSPSPPSQTLSCNAPPLTNSRSTTSLSSTLRSPRPCRATPSCYPRPSTSCPALRMSPSCRASPLTPSRSSPRGSCCPSASTGATMACCRPSTATA